jgi:hypothetical protein
MAETKALPPLAHHIPAPLDLTEQLPPAGAPVQPMPPPILPLLRVRTPARVLAVGVFLGWSVDLLFYGKELGLSVFLFAAGILAAVIGLGWSEDAQPLRRNLWLVTPILFFAAMAFVRANAFLTVLNVLATLALLALFAYFYAEGRVDRLGLIGYPVVIFLAGINAFIQTPPVVAASVDLRTARRHGGRWVAPVLRGLVLAVPVLGVFTCLLASADMIFADYLENVIRLEFLRQLPELGLRLTIVFAATWLLTGGLVYALGRHAGPATVAQDPPGSVPPARILGATEVATILCLVNGLFAAFVWIQFTYLFGAQNLTMVADHVYKQYARRGFGELVVVSVLTLGLILSLRWLARHDTPRQTRVFQALGTVLILLTLVILASAWSRMFYWEAVADYIYTELRLYVRVFIVWLAITLLWALAGLWVRRDRFAIGAFIAALGFLATLNLMNPDDDVVRYNIARAQTTQELYVPYLAQLSDDAVPAMVQLLDQVPGVYRDQLRAELGTRLARMDEASGWRAWQSFHLAHTEAYRLLSQNRERLTTQALPAPDLHPTR